MSMIVNCKEYVFAVFGSDGCECDSLEAIFASQELADAYIAKLRSGPMMTLRNGVTESETATFYGQADLLEVRVVQVRRNLDGENETHRRLNEGKD